MSLEEVRAQVILEWTPAGADDDEVEGRMRMEGTQLGIIPGGSLGIIKTGSGGD